VNERARQRLGFWQAASIIAGYGIGGGVLALPYLVSLNGLALSLAIIAVAYLLSLLLHLMIAELSAGDGTGSQIIELFRKYLLTGKSGQALTWLLFVLMGLAFLANLAAYVAGGREIFAALGTEGLAGSLLFYALAAVVAAMGLRALGVAESLAVTGMAMVFAVLAILTALRLGQPAAAPLAAIADGASAAAAAVRPPAAPTPFRLLALYGMSMFSFAAFFSVPQAAKGLGDRPRLIVPAVAVGIGINFTAIFIVTILALAVPGEVTTVATIGWTRALGPAASVLGAVFVTLAMLSSYWSLAQALVTILRERLGLGHFPAFLLATLPTLALSFLGGFLGFMRTAGGGIAVLVAVLLVPTFSRYRRATAFLALLPGPLASSAAGWLSAIAYIVMAIGSMVPLR
jgi:amino acid permease